jgi:polysaccharide pyruvyl transferase WcaK-like protein
LLPLEENYKSGMKNFDFISVRERNTQQLLKGLTDKEVHYCCDPVLLYKAEDFAFVPELNEKGYIYVNILDKTKGFDEYISALSERMNKKVLFYSNSNILDGDRVEDVYGDGPLEFIERIRSADCVVTNSFHSVIFSILFHKKFAVLVRADQSLKLRDLLSELGLEDRIVKGNPKGFDIDSEIDWETVDEKLEALRKGSNEFLEKALNAEYN